MKFFFFVNSDYMYESGITYYMICSFCCWHVKFSYSTTGGRQMFNISWLAGGHPILNPGTLKSEANMTFGILVDFIQSANRLPGALTISVISWYVSGCIPLFLCIYFSMSSWCELCLISLPVTVFALPHWNYVSYFALSILFCWCSDMKYNSLY